jgi:protein TonB
MTLGETGSPRFIHKESPIYPFLARKLGKQGHVILRVALNDQGQLQGIDTVESSGFGFAEAASAAIRKSTFAPAASNGKAISSKVLVPVRFMLQ